MGIVKNKKSFQSFFIIFLTSFLLGIVFSFSIANYTNKSLLKNQVSTFSSWSNGDLDLKRFWQVYDYVKKNYYSIWEVKKDELVEFAIKWMIDGLKDKHSEYMTASETQKFHEVLQGDFEWIGAVVEKTPLWVEVERIIKWSPAKDSGILKGDIIIEANGVELKDLDLYDAVDNIKWPAGTHVTLKILRVWEKEVIGKDVMRWKITIPSVDYEFLDVNKDIWYIALNIFWDHTEDEFKKALKELFHTKGMIIDLRDNGGWYLQSAVAILSELIEDDEDLVFTKYRNIFDNRVYKSVNDGNIYKWKIVVLINGNSASASEITAWALHDYKKAILVWKKSYGKWSVQQPFDIQWWGTLKITIAKWFTPEGKNIDAEGIDVDIEVDFEKEDYDNNYDRQLEEAKKVLDNFIQYDAFQLSIDRYKSTQGE